MTKESEQHPRDDRVVQGQVMRHTPGPWMWWTSNSWRRLKRDGHGITENVLSPYVMRDGHPDVSVSEEDMALIAAAPDLFAALAELVDEVDFDAHPEDFMPVWHRARAALRKATTGSR